MPVLPLADSKPDTPGEDTLLPGATKLDLTQILNAVAQSPQSVLLLDYDGTLAPFHNQRDQAFPYPGVAGTLQAIAGTGRTRIVIVTGRDASEIVPLLGLRPHPEVWGLHGLQRLSPDGSTSMLPLDKPTLHALAHAESWLDYQKLRQVSEFKCGSIAVHWRDLGEYKAAEIRERVLLGWRPIAADASLELLEFDGGVEIRPPKHDKGDAVRTVLAELNSSAPAAYLGDDSTDEPAFLAIRSRGLGVLVRAEWRKTYAQAWLRPPVELLDFLARWLNACQDPTATNPKKDLQKAAGADR